MIMSLQMQKSHLRSTTRTSNLHIYLVNFKILLFNSVNAKALNSELTLNSELKCGIWACPPYVTN